MSHRIADATLLLLLLFLSSAPVAAQESESASRGRGGGREVYLSTSQGVDRINLAMPAPDSPVELQTAAERIVEVARRDLHFTGMFRTVDPSLYELVHRDVQPGETERVTAKRWQSIGAQYLVRSQLNEDADRLILEAYLVDLVSGDEVMGKRYTAKTDLERTLAHHVSDDILAYFTGTRGVFTTKIIYASRRGKAQEIFVADYDGANETPLTDNGSLNLSPAVSPDGTLAAYTSYTTGQPRLHLADMRSGKTRLLYDCPGMCHAAAWSPDGRRLAFTLSLDGNSEIYVLERDGNKPTRLTNHPAIDVSPTWSPTGNEIAFVSDRTGRPQIYLMDRHGLNVRRATWEFEQGTEPAWSPKGDQIAYTGRHRGSNRVCLLDLPTNEESCFPPIGSQEEGPAWSPEGSHLAFLVQRGGSSVLYMRRSDGVGDAQPVFLRGDPRTPSWYR